MQKPAQTDVSIHDLIRNRWSPRAFADKKIPPEALRALFEAARWAPSSNNEQPWAYIAAPKDASEDFANLLSILVEFNQSWAKDAPLLALSVAHLNWQKSGKPNALAKHDVGSATAQLTFEANSRGLFVHQMAGFDGEKARRVFGIPEDWEPVAAMAIGYLGDPASLPAALRDRELTPRTRKSLAEFVMEGSWGHTAPFVQK